MQILPLVGQNLCLSIFYPVKLTKELVKFCGFGLYKYFVTIWLKLSVSNSSYISFAGIVTICNELETEAA